MDAGESEPSGTSSSSTAEGGPSTPTEEQTPGAVGATSNIAALSNTASVNSATRNSAIDPAGLIAGLLAIAVSGLVDPGPWSFFDSIVATLVVIVLIAFYVTSPDWPAARYWEKGAATIMVGTTIAIALAFPVQQLIARWWPLGERGSDVQADWAVCIAAICTVTAYCRLRSNASRTGRRIQGMLTEARER